MTANPGKYIMRVYRGATFRKVITWKNENNIPFFNEELVSVPAWA